MWPLPSCHHVEAMDDSHSPTILLLWTCKFRREKTTRTTSLRKEGSKGSVWISKKYPITTVVACALASQFLSHPLFPLSFSSFLFDNSQPDYCFTEDFVEHILWWDICYIFGLIFSCLHWKYRFFSLVYFWQIRLSSSRISRVVFSVENMQFSLVVIFPSWSSY